VDLPIEANLSPDLPSANLPLLNSSTRIPALDGLRGIAISLVLLWHAVFQLQPTSRFLAHLLVVGRLTWSGVDLFFVLSGFLIGGILLDAQHSPRYFKTFYLRRAFRILPLYAVALLLFSIRFLPFRAHPFLSPIPLASYFTFTQNIWMAAQGIFGAVSMSATWSLAVEEQFYLTAPFIVRGVTRSGLTGILVSAVFAAPLLRMALHLLLPHGNFAAAVLMPTRADALSLGFLCALLARNSRSWTFLLARPKAINWITAAFFLGFAALSGWGYRSPTLMAILGYSWVALFYTGCLLIAITGSCKPLVRLLCNRYLRQLGLVAYCTYLFHQSVIEGIRNIMLFPHGQILGGLVGIVITIAVARLSWTFFEKPLLRRGHAYQY
jgi:peptidoglycan/LPS O-acetylase OafA/YrhL